MDTKRVRIISMEKNVKLYHGSNVIVDKPELRKRGYTKDFGYGFYCTYLEKPALRLAYNKNKHVVNTYNYSCDNKLHIKTFKEIDEEWLEFIVKCRIATSDENPHVYDIVEGAMADDTIWNFVESYMIGQITKEQFMTLAKFKHPTHQIVFCTEKALKTISFEGAVDYDDKGNKTIYR